MFDLIAINLSGENGPKIYVFVFCCIPSTGSISFSLVHPPTKHTLPTHTHTHTLTACLALPKLNLQFLTLHDYLLRNFELFRLESTCELCTGRVTITTKYASIIVKASVHVHLY